MENEWLCTLEVSFRYQVRADEQGRTSPMMRTEHKWRRALERAGVVFLDADDEWGPGVRLRGKRKD